MPRDFALELERLIESAAPELARESSSDRAQRPSPESWSKCEILGHLIDSAANNHQRFVRAQQEDELRFPAYDPPAWVACQRYGECDWSELVSLWVAYNRHLVHVLRVMPREQLDTSCWVDWCETPQSIPLRAVIEEYLKHVRHHLGQLAR